MIVSYNEPQVGLKDHCGVIEILPIFLILPCSQGRVCLSEGFSYCLLHSQATFLCLLLRDGFLQALAPLLVVKYCCLFLSAFQFGGVGQRGPLLSWFSLKLSRVLSLGEETFPINLTLSQWLDISNGICSIWCPFPTQRQRLFLLLSSLVLEAIICVFIPPEN